MLQIHLVQLQHASHASEMEGNEALKSIFVNLEALENRNRLKLKKQVVDEFNDEAYRTRLKALKRDRFAEGFLPNESKYADAATKAKLFVAKR